MSDLTSVVEFAGSIAVVALPIIVLLRLVAANGASGISDLFMVTVRFDVEAGPPEEETPPRWHPERLTPPRPVATSEDRPSPRATIPAGGRQARSRPAVGRGTVPAADGSVSVASRRGSGRAG